jgi:hypothetical protein
MQKSPFITLILLLLTLTHLHAQSDCLPLPAVAGDGMDALGDLMGGGKKITKACIITEEDASIAIKLFFEGFTDKEYFIYAKVLNAAKKPLKEFNVIKIPASSTTADLQFECENTTTKEVASKFLSIIITTKDDTLVELGTTINGTSKMFKLERKWKPKGGVGADGKNRNENTVVTAKLTPYLSATTIKQ